jgi:imidazolonepropionase
VSARLVVRHIGRLTTWTRPVVEDGAVVIDDAGAVAWTGPDRDLPAGRSDSPELDAAGAAVLPGFVDSHTHAVWAGDRRDDFCARLDAGGYSPAGIASTVAATRAASTTTLSEGLAGRLRTMAQHGTTTVEVKTGYGLTHDDELRLITVVGRAAQSSGLDVTTTYLGAHVVPDGRDRAEYVDEVVATLPAAVAQGARWCDVFCDEGAFTVSEARRILLAARAVGLGLRIHAEQLTHSGGAALAAELGCASADHLDHVSAADAAAMAAAGVVGVLVPVASLYTRSGSWQHADVLRGAGVTVAIATDCNPGTSWCESMPVAIQLACLQMGLPVEAALRAATLGGAAALRRTDVGRLGPGTAGDLIVLDSDHEVDVAAHLGVNPVRHTVSAGEVR